MVLTIRAVYEGGMLRPVGPLPLAEGEIVEVTVSTAKPPDQTGPFMGPPTPEEEDYARRLRAAKSLEEMHAIMTTAPQLPDDYDLCRALNANRKATGERLLYPELEDGDST